MSEGTVYVLINEAMPGYVKVGKTSTSVEQRMKELDTSGVPIPFECFHASRVSDASRTERLLHDAFLNERVRDRREFFRIDPERVTSALLLAEIEDVTPREDVVEDADDQAALNKARTARSVYNFRLVDVPQGAVLTFSKDSSITATVVDEKRIEFEDKVMSMSAAALKIVQRMGYNWQKIGGPSYWEFEGETLSARRARLESNIED